MSSRGKSKGCLATFVERKTRFYIALPTKDRSKDSMFEAINKLVKSLPKEALKASHQIDENNLLAMTKLKSLE